jgi:hypothetical protein
MIDTSIPIVNFDKNDTHLSPEQPTTNEGTCLSLEQSMTTEGACLSFEQPTTTEGMCLGLKQPTTVPTSFKSTIQKNKQTNKQTAEGTCLILEQPTPTEANKTASEPQTTIEYARTSTSKAAVAAKEKKNKIKPQKSIFGHRLFENRTGFPDGGIWGGGSKGELEKLYQEGQEGINLPMDLGPNLERNGRMVLQPIQRNKGEKLVMISPSFKNQRKHTWKLAAEKVADRLSLAAGHNVGEWRAWENGKGNKTVRPKYVRSAMLHESGIFCDNMVWDAPKEGDIHAFLKALGYIPKQRNQKGTDSDDEDSGKNYSVSTLSKLGKRVRCRVALADIPLDEVKFIRASVHYLTTMPRQTDNAKLYTMYTLRFKAELQLYHVDMRVLFKTIPDARNIEVFDSDLANDGPGCLNSDAGKRILLKEGLPLMDEKREPKDRKGHGSGVNCIKTRPFNPTDDSTSNKTVIVKFYNKDAETKQNPAVRQTRGCKMSYLLNPSTRHMRKNARDEEFYKNGHTRCELTFGGEWEWEEMIETFIKYNELLRDALVVCSTSDALTDMGTYITRSIGIFFPLVPGAKIKQLCDHREDSDKTIQNMPDGFLYRFFNEKTGKSNSVVVSPTTEKYGDAFTLMQKVLAWGSTCGEDPILYVCVAGSEQYLRKRGGPLNLFFREVSLSHNV